MSSSGVVPGRIISTRNINGRFRSVESMAMTTWTSSYVSPLMSLVDLSLVVEGSVKRCAHTYGGVQILAGMRLRYSLLRMFRRMNKVSNASSKASHIKGTPLYSISLITISFDLNRLEHSDKGGTKRSKLRELSGATWRGRSNPPSRHAGYLMSLNV